MSIKNMTLIGKLSISNWEAKKKAKEIETKAEKDSGAKHGTISARKSLLPGASSLEAVIKHSAAMRTWWNTVSAPWFDNGMRIYNIAGHIDIMAAYGDMARERDRLIEVFLQDYPALREQARFDLNDLFDENEYPDEHVVRSRFTCSFEVMPLPEASDIRVVEGLDPAELARIEADVAARTEARMREATASTVDRMQDVLRTMATRLTAYTAAETADVKGNRFFDSWIENVKEMAKLMPQLNLSADPALDAFAEEVMAMVGRDTADYKTTPELRTEAATKAAELSRRLATLFADE